MPPVYEWAACGLALAGYTAATIGISTIAARVGYIRREDSPGADCLTIAEKDRDYWAGRFSDVSRMVDALTEDRRQDMQTIAALTAKVEEQSREFERIEAMQTSGANGTVRRMASVARKALAA